LKKELNRGFNKNVNIQLRVHTVLPVLFLILLFCACSKRPSYVLSERKMEKVLYDIYLAEAEINANYSVFSADSTSKQELLNSVLKKHKITEVVLDTSLVWYSGNLEKYFLINERVGKRFSAEIEKLKAREEAERKLNVISADNGLILPVEHMHFLLRQSDLLNNVYTFKADTLLKLSGGAYELQFKALGISDTHHRPVVTLSVQGSDTTFVRRDTIGQNGLFTSSVDIPSGKQTQSVNGYIYFPEVYQGMAIFIQNFTLSHSSVSQRKPLSAIQPAE